jgi:hypothetical protein
LQSKTLGAVAKQNLFYLGAANPFYLTLSISCLLALLPQRGKQASAKKVVLSTKGA